MRERKIERERDMGGDRKESVCEKESECVC